MHPSIDWGQPFFGSDDDPVGQIGPGKGQADAFPFAFLAVQWQGIAVFLHHDMGNHRWRGDRMRDDRLRHGCFQDGRLSLLAAGTAFITFTIEILHFHAGWDVDDFRTDEFFAYWRKCAATFRADRRFRFDDNFLMRQFGQ